MIGEGIEEGQIWKWLFFIYISLGLSSHLIKKKVYRRKSYVSWFLSHSIKWLFICTHRKMLCYGCHHESSGNNHHHSETVFNCMYFSTKREQEKYPLNPFAHSGSISLYLFLRQFSLSRFDQTMSYLYVSFYFFIKFISFHESKSIQCVWVINHD